MITFPKDFFWGAAASAYQVEGNNVNSDWWEWEKRTGLKETSGAACRHYELYEEDFDLAKSLGHNCHRLSIEWSRIEPEEGKFSDSEIRHYQNVILALRRRSIEPIVTLHHFTNPLWFSKSGGWQNRGADKYFLRYAEKAVSSLCDNVKFWVTINEPTVYVYYSYLTGKWPPQEKSFLKAKKVIDNLASAHIKTYKLIHKIYNERKLPHPFVSIAHHVREFVPCDAGVKNRLIVYLKDKFFNQHFIKILAGAKSLDFLGINYYTFDAVGENNSREIKKNSLGWGIYPAGLLNRLLSLKKYRLPIFILENGICTQNDNERWDFIREHLISVHRAIGQGIKVLGYVYWSLTDNYEWTDGFCPRFGLAEVDYDTFKRTIRDSAKKYSFVCKSGILEESMGLGYRQWRAPEPKAVFILVHGLGTHSGRWEAAADFFLKKGISSYAVELRDIGPDGKADERPENLDSYCSKILRLYDIAVKENPAKKIFLAGESLGAIISFLLCVARPRFFSGLICISPAFAPRGKLFFRDYIKIFAPLFYNPEKQLALPFDSSMCTRDIDYRKRLDEDPLEYRSASARQIFEILLAQIRARAIKKKMLTPVLFLIAREDKIVDSALSRKVFKDLAVKDKTLVDFPGMYHALSIELGKEAVFEEMLRWAEIRIEKDR